MHTIYIKILYYNFFELLKTQFMKKKLLSILTLMAFTVTMQAQNTFLTISNSPTAGGRFVIPNNAALNVTATQSKTITFRIMIPSGVSNNVNFSKIMLKNDTAAAGAGSYGILFGSSTTVPHTDMRLIATNTTPTTYGNASNTSLASTLNDGKWHHFALVLNDNTDQTANPTSKSNLYFDGVLIASSTNVTNIQSGPIDFTNVSDLIFGASATGGSVINGMAIDDIRIWNSALTASQINADKTTDISISNASMTSNLLAAYDFQSPATITAVPDITGKTVNANAIVGSSTTALTNGSSNLSNNSFNANSLKVVLNLNSANNILNISAPGANAAISVVVFDVSGKTISSTKSDTTSLEVSLSNASSGIYIVNVTDGTSNYSQKIIKNN